jgi:MYXO-CTERM domain-containing protein
MSLRTNFKLIATTTVLGLACTAMSAHAGVIAPDLNFTLQVNNDNPIHLYPAVEQTGPTTWSWNGTYAGDGWAMPFCNITADTDPIVTSNITFVNNTLATQTYTIVVEVPVEAVGPGSFMDGSMGGSVTDANGSGFAMISALPEGAVYSALIDGNVVWTLLNDPFSASPANNGGTATYSDSFGQPVPVGGPSVTSTIGIMLQFQLTAGDSVAMTSFFRVEPIPAPAGLALLGLAGLAGRSRRRA